jgi:hypothetical protein
MDTKNIIEIGFIKAFISEYYEYKIHSYYPDKDRLLYVMCNSEQEKYKITAKKIKQTRLKIKNLGNEELSFAYVLSCKPESLYNFIEPSERYDFWLNKFINDYEDNFISFQPIIEAVELFENQLSIKIDENEFWNLYPTSEKPIEQNIYYIIEREVELLLEIENIINDFLENGCWEFDFNEIEKYKNVNKPIENLFNISELFVQLNRLEMFNDFILPIQQVETKPELQKEIFKNNFDNVKPIEIYNHFKAGLADKGYLTEQELNEYLKAAFELQTIPEALFKFKDAPTKQKITNIFYQYFKNIAGTPHGKQIKYAALLGDYFVGYVTKNVSTNFNK